MKNNIFKGLIMGVCISSSGLAGAADQKDVDAVMGAISLGASLFGKAVKDDSAKSESGAQSRTSSESGIPANEYVFKSPACDGLPSDQSSSITLYRDFNPSDSLFDALCRVSEIEEDLTLRLAMENIRGEPIEIQKSANEKPSRQDWHRKIVAATPNSFDWNRENIGLSKSGSHIGLHISDDMAHHYYPSSSILLTVRPISLVGHKFQLVMRFQPNLGLLVGDQEVPWVPAYTSVGRDSVKEQVYLSNQLTLLAVQASGGNVHIASMGLFEKLHTKFGKYKTSPVIRSNPEQIEAEYKSEDIVLSYEHSPYGVDIRYWIDSEYEAGAFQKNLASYNAYVERVNEAAIARNSSEGTEDF